MTTKPKTQKPAAKAIKRNASAASAKPPSTTAAATAAATTTESASKAAGQATAASKRPAAKAALALPHTATGGSKQSQLIACLQSSAGASIAQMMTLTGWQAHTVRGTISGVLRKKLGLHVTCDARSGNGERLCRIQGTVA